jgi:putative MATE family efflux protein
MAAAPAAPLDARTRRLLEGPIAPTLLRLAWPNVLVMGAQAGAGLVETWFVGRLGTDALAGMALAFPVVMLMQMTSNGAVGGGIASAVARALGARRQEAADAVVRHALAIAVAFGLVFTAAVLGGGRWLYGRMGGQGGSLEAALAYSDVVFAGAVLVWVFNALAALLRGTGNMAVPAWVSCVGTLCLLPLSPLLIFGWGPVPGLGIAGGGVALLAYYAGGSAVLAAYLLAGRALVRPRRGPLHGEMLRGILRIGLLGAVSTVATNLTIGIATAQVGRFGPAAIAGYGTAVRLEYLLVPLVFGLGAPLVAMVGACMGAGLHARALRATWTGAALAMLISGSVGLCAAVFPQAWLGLFASDPAMIEAGSRYLRAVGPFYAFFGLGLVLYFASQGAGRLFWPVAGNIARLGLAAGGGWLALRAGGGLGSVFAAHAAALALYGLLNAGTIAGGAWFGRPGWPCTTAVLLRRLART